VWRTSTSPQSFGPISRVGKRLAELIPLPSGYAALLEEGLYAGQVESTVTVSDSRAASPQSLMTLAAPLGLACHSCITLFSIPWPGDIVTRDELRRELWSADTLVGFDDGLNVAANKLRMALGDSADNPIFVETILRRGYRFLAPVTRLKEGTPGLEPRSPNADLPEADWLQPLGDKDAQTPALPESEPARPMNFEAAQKDRATFRHAAANQFRLVEPQRCSKRRRDVF
jgi:hypothetical protein